MAQWKLLTNASLRLWITVTLSINKKNKKKKSVECVGDGGDIGLEDSHIKTRTMMDFSPHGVNFITDDGHKLVNINLVIIF